MTILMAHNFYQQPGGEDLSYRAEVAMLEAYGHRVVCFEMHNKAIEGMNLLAAAARTLWNPSSYRELRALIRRERPEIAHFQNTFPLLSPAAYYAAKAEGVPVVQTLRNYRLLCPEGFMFRDGQTCRQCVGKAVAWRSVVHGCYHNSRAGSAVTSAMLASHRALGTWHNAVDVYCALTEYSRSVFIEGGLPQAKIMVKPNMVTPDPGVGSGAGGFAVFAAGRLSAEKGADVVLDAWRQLGSLVPLKIAGQGEMAAEVEAATKALPSVQWLGWRTPAELGRLFGEALFVVVASRGHESLPRVVVDAYARGTPVVASRVGPLPELVDHGRTGRLYASGDSASLAQEVRGLLADKTRLAQARHEARREFEEKFSVQRNYELLMGIYAAAKRNAASSARTGTAITQIAARGES